MTSAEQTLAEAGGKSSFPTSTPDAGRACAMCKKQRRELARRAGVEDVSGRRPDRSLRSQSAADLTKTASSRTEEKETSANRESESASDSRPSHSVKSAAPEVAAAASLPELIPVATASLSQPVPVAAVASPIAQDTDSRTRSTHTETSADPFY